MTHSPGGGGGGEGGAIAAAAAEAAASFFAAASAVEAAGGLPAASTFGYLLPAFASASGHGAIPAVAALAGAPLYRTTAVPPPPPVPHVAYFAYAPNTAPITVSITYPSSSSSSSSVYFDSPFRPCSRTQWAAPCTSSDDANSSASSLSGFRADAPMTPRRDRFRFGHGDWSASLSLDDAEASTMTSSPPPLFPCAILDEPECLEVQPVDSMFGAGDWTINAVVKGAMVLGGVGAGGKGVGALTGGLASQGDGPCGTMGAMRRDSQSSGASSVGESSCEDESCSSSSCGHSDAVTAVSLVGLMGKMG